MPFHPIFVHFPIAFILLGYLADWRGFFGKPSALVVGWTCILAALLTTLISIMTGVGGLNSAHLDQHTARLVFIHMRIGVVLGLLLFGLTIWRAWLAKVAGRGALGFMICYTVLLGLLGFQGWYGGELAYSHGVGVAAANRGMVSPARAEARLDAVAGVLEKIPGFQVQYKEFTSPNRQTEVAR